MSSSLRAPQPLPAAPASLRSSSAATSTRSSLTNPARTINCSLKQKQNRSRESRDSPLHAAEEIAARLGLDFAIADLERLFRSAAGGGGSPPAGGDDSGRPVRVAYQGVCGSYCHDAAARAFPSPAASEAFPCQHFEDAFAALEDRSADRAIVPAENSLDGPIDRNLDLLLRHPSVRIVGELVLPVNHCLLALDLGPVRRVVSHPQALSHCEPRLHALGVEIEEVACAAAAARYIAENQIRDTAVIGSRIAAREFGLNVVEENLQGPGRNFTRYLQLGLGGGGGGGCAASAAAKTTVAFALERGPSDLFKAMWGFESQGVRVTRVDHRPNRARPIRVEEDGSAIKLDYVFVIEVEGGETDADVAAAVERLKEFAGYVRVLGSYTCAGRM